MVTEWVSEKVTTREAIAYKKKTKWTTISLNAKASPNQIKSFIFNLII